MVHVAIKTDDESAKKEPPVKGESLLQELLPLMEEYFIGDISLIGQTLLYRLPNGQKFRIAAWQI